MRLDVVPGRDGWSDDTLLADAAPAVLFNWAPLQLTRAQAKQLQRDLTAVLDRYRDNGPPPTATPSHLLGLFLTPLRS